MPNSHRSALIALALAAGVGSAFANSDNGAQTVVTVVLHDSGNALVTFAGGTNSEVCNGVAGGKTLAISKADPNFKVMYAAALTGLTTGRTVSAWANGCVDLWGNGTSMTPRMTLIGVN